MITRKDFGEKLVACVAAGTLANFALVAAPADDMKQTIDACQVGKDGCAVGQKQGSDSCGNSGGRGQDGCRGNGARADACTAPAPDAQPPACKTDTCAASDKPSGNE